MYRLLAALMFFTKLPFINRIRIPEEYFRDVINYWYYTGLLTSATMVGVYMLFYQILGSELAIIAAILSRVLLTGALHEDGFADFFDGFGGGRTKEKILMIMKDSRVGTYGVIALILYFLTFYKTLENLPYDLLIKSLLIGDPLAKFISSQITLFLKYSRKVEESKSGVIYLKGGMLQKALQGVLCILMIYFLLPQQYYLCVAAPIVVFASCTIYLAKKIGGYTGDCCGAVFVMSELSFYMAILITYNI